MKTIKLLGTALLNGINQILLILFILCAVYGTTDQILRLL